MTLEKDVERYLVERVKSAGGMCVKFIPDQRTGMPDRIVMLPGGTLIWVELKRPEGGSVSAVQKHRHRELRALGQSVAVCLTKADVDALLRPYA